MGFTPPAYSPAQVRDPFPDSVPSCRYFHSRFFSEEKEAKKVARLQGVTPCAGPCIPFHQGEIRYRTAHGVFPLSRFPPFDQVPEYNPHVLMYRDQINLIRLVALQGVSNRKIGLALSSLPTRLRFLTFPYLKRIFERRIDPGYVFTLRTRRRCRYAELA